MICQSFKFQNNFGSHSTNGGYLSHLRKNSFQPSLLRLIVNSETSQLTKNVDFSYKIEEVNAIDFFSIFKLSTDEFFPTTKGTKEQLQLIMQICYLFVPKLLFPNLMKHSLIGAKTPSGELIGFVDLSLQTSSGSLLALKSMTYSQRSTTYDVLKPYLCNLLIAPKYRRRGIAKRLIKSCEIKAKEWEQSEIYLHADITDVASMKLYISLQFEPIQRNDNLVFMRRTL